MRVGPLLVRACGGSDGHGGGDGPAIVLCHGFGAPGDDLVSLAQVVEGPRGLRWFFPEAPLTIDLGPGVAGRAWWHIDMMRLQLALMTGAARELSEETPDRLADAADELRSTIAALCQHHGVTRERLLLGGFSQGAMLTTEVALHDAGYAGLVVLSGNLISRARWQASTAARGLAVLQSHGRADPILPFAGAVALQRLFESCGASVRFCPFSGEHEISQRVLAELGSFARERLSA